MIPIAMCGNTSDHLLLVQNGLKEVNYVSLFISTLPSNMLLEFQENLVGQTEWDTSASDLQ